MNRPSLSVIMPNYNHGRFLRQSLAAIAEQSYQPAEILVVDDASTDDSLAILSELCFNNRRIRLLRNERNMGVIATLNHGLANVTGDYVVGASADDKILPGLFEKSLNILIANPSAALCSSLSYLVGEDLQPIGDVYCPIVSKTPAYLPPEDVLRKLRSYGSWFLGNTTIYKRGALLEAGGFLPELSSYCDGFVSLVLALKHGACFIPERLACWRRLPSGFSAQSSVDPAQSLRIMEVAGRLMRARHRELFPEDFIRQWERDWFFNLLDDTLTFQRDELARLKGAAPSPAALNRLKLNLLLGQNAAQRLLARSFHGARLRRFLLRSFF
jgi:glycosyltransferase involved in cell wall biosynthesis